MIKRLFILFSSAFCVSSAFALTTTQPYLPAVGGLWDGKYINQIYSFGDSLTDIGNLGDPAQFPRCDDSVAPDTNGCSETNGPYCAKTWVAYLGEDLNIPITASRYNGNNFAVIGAEYFDTDPNTISNQYINFLSTTPNISASTLFTIWAGANDIKDHLPHLQAELPSIIAQDNIVVRFKISSIIARGGKNILVLGLPDLSATPLARTFLSQELPQIQRTSQVYNCYLTAELTSLQSSLGNSNGTQIYTVDTFAFLDDVVNNYQSYGFLHGIDYPHYYNYCFLNPGDNDAAHYIFYNDFHPSSYAHHILAESVRNCDQPGSFCHKIVPAPPSAICQYVMSSAANASNYINNGTT